MYDERRRTGTSADRGAADRSSVTVRRMVLIGATGMIGRAVMKAAMEHPEIRLTALARREAPMPEGARMEMFIADPAAWPQAIADMKPDILGCALGTPMRRDLDEDAFKALDRDFVLACAEAAGEARVRQLIAVSAAGADRFARETFPRTKGEVEHLLKKMPFGRVDLLRPGPLRADTAEQGALARIAAPLADLVKRTGKTVPVSLVAEAMLALAGTKADGRYVHESEALDAVILRAAARRAVPVQQGE